MNAHNDYWMLRRRVRSLISAAKAMLDETDHRSLNEQFDGDECSCSACVDLRYEINETQRLCDELPVMPLPDDKSYLPDDLVMQEIVGRDDR